jgi:hypothetical protein
MKRTWQSKVQEGPGLNPAQKYRTQLEEYPEQVTQGTF